MKIHAITTCHNRRDLTLRALSTLLSQELPDGVCLEVSVVDDGSTDGSGEAIQTFFPQVNLVSGGGNLFWAGGMCYAWAHIAARFQGFLFVFNDDVEFYPGALKDLLRAARCVGEAGCEAYALAGSLIDPVTKKTSYGGVSRCSWWHPLRFALVEPSEVSRDCDTLNMNAALISQGAIARIGFLDDGFVHAKADYDYGLRLRQAGGRVVLAPCHVGECTINPVRGTHEELGISLSERWRRLTSPKGAQSWRERYRYVSRHGGLRWPFIFVLPYMSFFFRHLRSVFT